MHRTLADILAVWTQSYGLIYGWQSTKHTYQFDTEFWCHFSILYLNIYSAYIALSRSGIRKWTSQMWSNWLFLEMNYFGRTLGLIHEDNESKTKVVESKTAPKLVVNIIFFLLKVRMYILVVHVVKVRSVQKHPLFFDVFFPMLLIHMWPYGVTKNSNYAAAWRAMVFCGMFDWNR